jgi:serine/threonine protein kinase
MPCAPRNKVKEFPDFVFAQRGNASIWLARDRASPSVIECFADPDRLFQRSDCVIVKDQKKIKVGRLSIEFAGEAVVCYVKRYNAFSARYRLQSLFACSGALRALKGAAILARIKVASARPIAVVEQRAAKMLVKSFFISQEIQRGKTADAYWREVLANIPSAEGRRRRRSFLKQLATLFAGLHCHHVYHNDLKDANILVDLTDGAQAEGLFLLDLEGVRRYTYLSHRRRIKNLVQLHRTFGRYLTQSERWYFLTCYLSPAVIDRPARKRWAQEVLRQSARVNRNKSIANAA